ncbi:MULTISPECIES: MocR-like pyridoxine biosynthesis transcription factor PdxR [unclassified Modestobacter]|uniref:MocR-like pyridoxine biosynthesis transcription factor PdxR n=1 Tax=unclassified Modestobacter TaxID=2643866 RepID=UPI0022AB0795|nr:MULTISPECIES: PLP-dependent aminotransferase family protein [unclassified Modestobacter]MCZ2822790.1 PLP-dependent aminotransferase family protein [Modestobacter sp. VKM Ac-2981]MCZ2851036.1 PLP-dependent aminotransferase family protein [Modestobacter sp. VKM Ac-2982]
MRGADFLQLDPAAAPARGLTDWLTAAVRAAVLDGRLAAGDRLPATRTLAGDLGIARGVVVEVYQRLVDEGLVAARTGSGTVVLPRSVASPRRPAVATPAGPVRLPLPTNRPAAEGEIDLSPGVPDLAAFPRAAWLRAERAVLREASAADLGYGDPRGSARLRSELAGWLGRTRGLRVAPEQLLVVSGVAQALALLAQTLRSRGADTIGVEDPGSRGAREEFAHWGLRPVGVPVDADGLVLAGMPDVPAVMVTPAHQFPTGVVLSPARRRELLGWARDGGGLVIEDDYDAEHRYDRAPVPALQPSAPEHVAHTGSTSKTLAPGMRLGWLVAPSSLDADLVAAKHASDLGSPALPQLVLAELLRSGQHDRHLRLVRGRQRARRDALVTALAQHLPGAVVSGVAAGLHVLITLPGSDADDVELAASARDAGVVVHPLSWHRMTPGDPGLVLGYAANAPDRLRTAIERLADAQPRRPRR